MVLAPSDSGILEVHYIIALRPRYCTYSALIMRSVCQLHIITSLRKVNQRHTLQHIFVHTCTPRFKYGIAFKSFG